MKHSLILLVLYLGLALADCTPPPFELTLSPGEDKVPITIVNKADTPACIAVQERSSYRSIERPGEQREYFQNVKLLPVAPGTPRRLTLSVDSRPCFLFPNFPTQSICLDAPLPPTTVTIPKEQAKNCEQIKARLCFFDDYKEALSCPEELLPLEVPTP